VHLKPWSAIVLFVLLALPAGLALADNGPHGGYTATTDACAGCHRTHTAVAGRLLVNSVPNLCNTCHGNSGSGADTNVVDGIYLERDSDIESPAQGVANRGLKGGGFTNALMDTDWDGSASSTSVTSSHLADGSTGTAWGGGAIGSGAGPTIPLSCVSCHDPHGRAAAGGVATYRLLRTVPLSSTASSPITVTDQIAKTYTVSDNQRKSGNQYFGEGYDYNAGTFSLDAQQKQLSPWCAQCHTRYPAKTGGGRTSSGDPIFAYRHMSNDSAGSCAETCHPIHGPGPFIPNHGPMWNHLVECTTCHVAHGSSAHMGGSAGTVAWPDGAAAPDGDNRSSLLRVDNRGTCELCHGK
jgi:predicted CXXCH cytochrome family protein